MALDIVKKILEFESRYLELEATVSDPAVASDPRRLPKLLKDLGRMRPMKELGERARRLLAREADAREILARESDKDMHELAREELKLVEAEAAEVSERAKEILIAEEGDDLKSCIVEIRAGTGGDEASLFVADLFRLYGRFAEKRGWRVEVLDSHPTEVGGLKEIVFGVSGEGVYRTLRFESGGHRVQRVPETETQGRIHTSAVTIAVLPEVEEVELEINPSDLRVDTFRAGGAGGQHVNKTESAVRITHLPTGCVVSMQDEKSQHKNRAKAMRVLRSRVYDLLEQRKRKERDQSRRTLIGSGDRSDRIRTYNFPQNRITDHRINLTLHNLDHVMEGDLSPVVDRLVEHDRDERFKALKL